jgi:hypothetical protein
MCSRYVSNVHPLCIPQGTFAVGLHSDHWSHVADTLDPRTEVFPKELLVSAYSDEFGGLRYQSFIGARACCLRVDFRMLHKCPECRFVGSRCLASRHDKNHGERSKRAMWWLAEDTVLETWTRHTEDE